MEIATQIHKAAEWSVFAPECMQLLKRLLLEAAYVIRTAKKAHLIAMIAAPVELLTITGNDTVGRAAFAAIRGREFRSLDPARYFLPTVRRPPRKDRRKIGKRTKD